MKNATITMLFLIVIALIYQGIRISQLDIQVNKDITNQIEYLDSRIETIEILTDTSLDTAVDTSWVDTTKYTGE